MTDQAGSPDSNLEGKKRFQDELPMRAVGISVYHFVLLIGSLVGIGHLIGPVLLCVQMENGFCGIRPINLLLIASLFGVLGGTLTASRQVVQAVTNNIYETRRMLWQIMVPVHGGVLAVVGVFVIAGGMVTIAGGEVLKKPAETPENLIFFVGGFAFIVGFASETFVKALFRATRALLGEDTAADPADTTSRKNKPQHFSSSGTSPRSEGSENEDPGSR